MPSFSDITVVSVTGAQSVAAGAAYAIEHSARELPGSRALLLSPERPPGLSPSVEHRPIHPFGYMEYSLFMLYALHFFIETDYALVVQDDGWVLSGANWRDTFFDYDYVGAPVHLARVRQADGASGFKRGFSWCDDLDSPGASIDLILNGGFSLRSQKLMKTPQQLGLAFEIPPIAGLAGKEPRMVWQDDAVLEDVWLCATARTLLEINGIRFAPLDVARNFAIEHSVQRLHADYSLGTLFGHHSKFRKITSTTAGKLSMRYMMSEQECTQIDGEAAIVQMLKAHQWKIDWPAQTGLGQS